MKTAVRFLFLLLMLQGTGCTRCGGGSDSDKDDTKRATPKEEKEHIGTFLKSE